MPVPMEEASRFGIVVTDEDNRITEFEEKPTQQRAIWRQWYLHIQLEGIKGSFNQAERPE